MNVTCGGCSRHYQTPKRASQCPGCGYITLTETHGDRALRYVAIALGAAMVLAVLGLTFG